MKRLLFWSLASVFLAGAAGLAFARWRESPLHIHVCGPNRPYTQNIRWIIEGRRVMEGLPAKICGCTPPPGFLEHERCLGCDNPGRLAIEQLYSPEELHDFTERFMGVTAKIRLTPIGINGVELPATDHTHERSSALPSSAPSER